MRGLILGLVIFLVSLSLFSAPPVTGAVSDGFRLVSENENEVVVEFVLPNYNIDELKTDKNTYSVVNTTTQAYTTEVGMPYLPIFGTGIAVPNKGRVSYEIVDSEYSEIKLNNIFPSQKEGFVYDNINIEEINYQGYFPRSELSAGNNFILRDFRVKPITITPFQYNKEDKTLRIYNKITLKISTNSSETGENELLSSREKSLAFDKLYQATILNYHSENELSPNPNILFIYKENSDPIFHLKFEQYVKYKKQKGFNVLLASTSDIGSTSSSGIKSYIQNLYDGEDFRPDFVVLVGDVSGSFSIPTFNEYYADNAEGDYPYTHLAGNDLIGDIFIGRMSINSSTDLSRYYGKMRSYERISNPIDETYFNNMLLVGDTEPSGESTVNHCKFVKQISQRINPNYNYTEIYGGSPSVSEMNQAINDGIDFFVYRGYIGMSNWNPGNSQTNVHKINHGVIITCATGNFASTATTESYVNLGSEVSPKGGITAIGMATASTHTSFNNSLSGGIFHGIYNIGQRTMGEALLTGKVTTYIVYSESDLSDVKKFTHWCNLIGDPTVDVYTGEPNKFLVESSEFYADSDELIVLVKNQNNNPVNLASVTLTDQNGNIIKTLTNSQGIATLSLTEGEVEYDITVNKPNFYPLQETLSITGESDFRITSLLVDDDNEGLSTGNDNQNIEAGENIELNFMLENMLDTDINNVQATLTINNFQIDILEANSEISLLQAGSSALFDENFLIHINNNALNNNDIALILDFTYGDNQTKRLIQTARIQNGQLLLTNTNIVMLGNNLQADQTATITATLKNQSEIAIENASIQLIIDNGHFNVLTDNMLITNLADGQSQSFDFQVTSDIDMFPGMTAECILKIDNEVNFYQELEFSLKFGNSANGSPLGPDSFGYVIYDSNDIDYPECPVYEWIEIAPGNGGAGTALDIYDPEAYGEGDGVGSNSTDTINLPFQFIFYGESYNQITVCSNGFISFGENSNGEFRNWRLPGALGPNGMIAPFWDDMHMESNSGIYTYYDNLEDYFVIQWEQMISGAANSDAEETFQLILYNPQRYPSSLNQGTAKIQYQVFNNVDNGNPGSYTPWHGNYATIGIESPSGTDGLEYTYNQNYPAGAEELEDGMALFITTKPILLVEPSINIYNIFIMDENNNGIYEVNEEIQIGIELTNTALTPLTHPQATITCADSRIAILQNHTSFDDLTNNEVVSAREYFIIKSIEELENNEIITLNMEIIGDAGYHFYKDINVKINKPTLNLNNFIINDYSSTGNNNFIPEAGETIYLAWEINNTSLVDGFFDNVSVSTSNPYLTFATDTINNVKVKANSIQQLVFQALISATAPEYEAIEVVINAERDDEVLLEEESIILLNTSETSIDFDGDDVPIAYSTPWQVGSSNLITAHSGTNLLATSLNYDYPDDADVTAWTQYFNVTPATSFNFWHRYDIENNYDGAQIVLNIEGSSANIILTPDGNYTHQALPALGGPGYCGNLSQWTQVNVNIPETYIGESVRFGFRFASDSMETGDGWFIDDISIGGSVIESFVFAGDVDLIGSNEELSLVDISISDYNINPNSDGQYISLLPLNNYNAEYKLSGFRNDDFRITGVNSNIMVINNVALNYLNRPENLIYSLQDSVLTLSWDYEDDSDDEFTQFIVEKRFNTEEWEQVSLLTNNEYTCVINKMGYYSYRLRANYQEDYSNFSNEVSFDYLISTDNENNDVALVTSLQGNYPNPFNPETNIAYTLAKASKVKLKIFNLKGQLVKTLVNDYQPSGNHKIVWNGKNNQNRAVSSGIYFIKIETDDYQKTQKAILMK